MGKDQLDTHQHNAPHRLRLFWGFFINKAAYFLPKGELGRNILVVANSNMVAQAIVMLSMPVLTRLYTPSDFGVLAVFSAVLSMLTVLATLRYDWTLPIPEKDEEAIHLLVLSLFVVLVMGVLLSLGIGLAYNVIARWNYLAPIYRYLWLLPIGVWGVGGYQVLSVWIIRQKDLRPLARTKVTQSLSGVLVKLGGGVLRVGSIGLLVGNLIAQIAGIRLLAVLIWRKQEALIRSVRAQNLAVVARRYAPTALFSCGSNLLNTAGLQLTPILFSAYYGANEVGWFALSQRVVGIPIALIGSAVAQAFWAEAARLVHSDPQALQRLFFQATKRLLVVSLLVGLLGVVSPWVFGYVFGKENWQGAGIYTLYLTPLYVAQLIVSPISHLVVHERQQWQFLWDATRVLLVLICFLGASVTHQSADLAILYYSIVMMILYSILYGLNVWAIKLRIRSFACNEQR